jgi:hypothetical protein
MRRVRLLALVALAGLVLAACQNPDTNRLVRPAPGEWDASVWNTATWE